jgi:amidase
MNSVSGIIALRSTVSKGTTTIREALQQSFDRAHAAQPRLKAFSHLPATLDVINNDASAPLAGIAVAVKDLIDTADMPTTYGSPIHRGHVPRQDAWVVQRLRSLGAHVLGKTVTTEFAWRHPGDTVNPWNTEHTPGGSSSGSAAAVAAGIAPLGLGTQTLGSVIRPAAYCGIVGFKPSFGSIPRTGVCPLAESLDHVGLFARSVDDVAYALTLLAGKDASDLHGHPPPVFNAAAVSDALPSPPRIGLLQSQLLGEIDAPQKELINQAAKRFSNAGAEIIDAVLPKEFADAAELAVAIVAVEAARIHEARMAQFPQLISAAMRDLIKQGHAITASEYLALKARQRAMQQAFASWKEANRIDMLLMPPATGEAPKGLHYTGDPRFCSPITLLGVPAITLPAGFGPKGLPLGVQLVGSSGADLLLLRVARWCESVLAHERSFPAILP